MLPFRAGTVPSPARARSPYNAAMARTLWIIIKHAWLGFTRKNLTQLAAAISYYALFSLVPLGIFAVSVAGFVLADETRRAELVNNILSAVPLSQDEGRRAVERTLENVQRASGPIAAVGLGFTLWTSSAMFASIRKSLNVVWQVDEQRPWARAKLIDFTQVGVLSAFLLGSIVLTGVLRVLRNASGEHVGPLAYQNPAWELPSILLPTVLTFIAFALMYRIVPAAHPRWRDILPGAAVATLLFEFLKNTFAIYVANFNNFDVVYGSLAGALLFLVYIYLASNILLIGAELAHSLQRYHAGEYWPELDPARPRTPVATLALRAVKGLFVRE